MRRRKKLAPANGKLAAVGSLLLFTLLFTIVSLLSRSRDVSSMLLVMKTDCLPNWLGCTCAWRGGKFVADCSQQGLKQVPNNDYFDHLLSSSSDNQMLTLNRDIQQLNLTANNISSLREEEFHRKKFRNLQKVYLGANKISRVHSRAFYMLTGLIELDLSQNFIVSLQVDDSEGEQQDSIVVASSREEQLGANNKTQVANSKSSRPKGSFLEHLAALRQLNLASNQLTSVEAGAFVQLSQLRQLILSR